MASIGQSGIHLLKKWTSNDSPDRHRTSYNAFCVLSTSVKAACLAVGKHLEGNGIRYQFWTWLSEERPFSLQKVSTWTDVDTGISSFSQISGYFYYTVQSWKALVGSLNRLLLLGLLLLDPVPYRRLANP